MRFSTTYTLRDRGPLASGYCMGGRMSVVVAGRLPDRRRRGSSPRRFAAGPTSGTCWPTGQPPSTSAGAENDPSFTADHAEKLGQSVQRGAGVPHRIECYPAAHGSCPDIHDAGSRRTPLSSNDRDLRRCAGCWQTQNRINRARFARLVRLAAPGAATSISDDDSADGPRSAPASYASVLRPRQCVTHFHAKAPLHRRAVTLSAGCGLNPSVLPSSRPPSMIMVSLVIQLAVSETRNATALR